MSSIANRALPAKMALALVAIAFVFEAFGQDAVTRRHNELDNEYDDAATEERCASAATALGRGANHRAYVERCVREELERREQMTTTPAPRRR